MNRHTRQITRIALALVLQTACSSTSTPAPSTPRPQPTTTQPVTPPTPTLTPSAALTAGSLPAIPENAGALAIDVVYPGEMETVTVRDSTFVFGSTGNGHAQLTINGAPVHVEPNGTFLGFLPVPANGLYHIVANLPGGQSVTLDRHARVPESSTSPTLEPGAHIVPGSVTPRGAWVAMPKERVDVSFRGTPSGQASLVFPDGSRIALVETRAVNAVGGAAGNFEGPSTTRTEVARGVSEYRGFFRARALIASDTTVGVPTLAELTAPLTAQPLSPSPDAASGRRGDAAKPKPSASPRRRVTASPRQTGAEVELVIGADTARSQVPLSIAMLERERTGAASERDPGNPDKRGFVIATVGIGGPYHYLWPNGTELTLTGERGTRYRVRLSSTMTAWTPKGDVRLLPAGTPPAHTSVGTIRMQPNAQSVDIHFAVSRKLPFHVDETEKSLTIDIYGATSDVNFMQYGGIDPLIARGEWSEPQDSVFRFRVDLTKPVWGYSVTWADNGDLVFRVRRPPAIDMEHPLRGLLIAVDPGHPPAGAIGPTRLTEASANLANALALKPLLEAAGARVLMLRTDNTAVPLNSRPLRAQQENADILVSMHNNAFPDGVNPFENNGTSVYYYQPHSVDLARDLQAELLREFSLRNLGIGRADLALVRPTWMPSALTETMFLMIPQQESSLRDATINQRIARAHVRGLEKFLRDRAQGITSSPN